jgi:hypothetical protein
VPVVPVIASVCASWRDVVAERPSELWRRADFSGHSDPTDAVITRYCVSGAWSELEHVDLRDCAGLTDASLAALALGAPNLTSLKVSDIDATASGIGDGSTECAKKKRCARAKSKSKSNSKSKSKSKSKSITASGVLGILANGSVARFEVDRLRVDSGTDSSRFLRAAITETTSAFGVRNAPVFPRSISSLLSDSGMPNLTVLDLTDTAGQAGNAALPWLELMQKCPRVRELRLTGYGGEFGWTAKPSPRSANDPWAGAPSRRGGVGSAGSSRNPAVWRKEDMPRFADLEVLELGAARTTTSAGHAVGRVGLGAELLWRLTHGSKKLRELDVTGARELGFRDIHDTTLEALESRAYSEEDLRGTLFCDAGGSALRTLRCAKTAWATTEAFAANSVGMFLRRDDFQTSAWKKNSSRSGFARGRPRFSNLKCLELGSRALHAPKVTDAALVALAAAYPQIEHLAIAGSAVTDAGVTCALRACSGLRSLDASGCRGLRRETRRAAGEGNIAELRREVELAARMDGKTLDRLWTRVKASSDEAAPDIFDGALTQESTEMSEL